MYFCRLIHGRNIGKFAFLTDITFNRPDEFQGKGGLVLREYQDPQDGR